MSLIYKKHFIQCDHFIIFVHVKVFQDILGLHALYFSTAFTLLQDTEKRLQALAFSYFSTVLALKKKFIFSNRVSSFIFPVYSPYLKGEPINLSSIAPNNHMIHHYVQQGKEGTTDLAETKVSCFTMFPDINPHIFFN